jgi:hypothetical protein
MGMGDEKVVFEVVFDEQGTEQAARRAQERVNTSNAKSAAEAVKAAKEREKSSRSAETGGGPAARPADPAAFTTRFTEALNKAFGVSGGRGGAGGGFLTAAGVKFADAAADRWKRLQGAIGTAAGGVAGAGGAVADIGKTSAQFATALAGVGKAVYSTLDSLRQTYAEYNPALAVQQARMERLAEGYRILESQKLGPALAEFGQAQMKIMGAWSRFLRSDVVRDTVQGAAVGTGMFADVLNGKSLTESWSLNVKGQRNSMAEAERRLWEPQFEQYRKLAGYSKSSQFWYDVMGIGENTERKSAIRRIAASLQNAALGTASPAATDPVEDDERKAKAAQQESGWAFAQALKSAKPDAGALDYLKGRGIAPYDPAKPVSRAPTAFGLDGIGVAVFARPAPRPAAKPPAADEPRPAKPEPVRVDVHRTKAEEAAAAAEARSAAAEAELMRRAREAMDRIMFGGATPKQPDTQWLAEMLDGRLSAWLT